MTTENPMSNGKRRRTGFRTKGFTVSIIIPVVELAGDGKTPTLSPLRGTIIEVVGKAAKAAHRAMVRPPAAMSIKEAIWAVMEQAYAQASDDGSLPANARQGRARVFRGRSGDPRVPKSSRPRRARNSRPHGRAAHRSSARGLDPFGRALRPGHARRAGRVGDAARWTEPSSRAIKAGQGLGDVRTAPTGLSIRAGRSLGRYRFAGLIRVMASQPLDGGGPSAPRNSTWNGQRSSLCLAAGGAQPHQITVGRR